MKLFSFVNPVGLSLSLVLFTRFFVRAIAFVSIIIKNKKKIEKEASGRLSRASRAILLSSNNVSRRNVINANAGASRNSRPDKTAEAKFVERERERERASESGISASDGNNGSHTGENGPPLKICG